MKLLDENIEQSLHDLEVGKRFLNEKQKVLTIKKKDDMGYIKIKTFCSSKIRSNILPVKMEV